MHLERLAGPIAPILIVHIALVATIASHAWANEPSEDIFLACGGQVLKIADFNGDGDAMDENEVTVFVDDLPPTITAIGCSADRLCIINTASTTITFLDDANHDGDALDWGEVFTFADLSTWLNDNPPVGLAIGESGAIYTVDTANGQLLRIMDLNGDGDAFDVGEVQPVAQDLIGALAIAHQPDASILAVMDDYAVPLRLLSDRNNDGDFLDFAENIDYARSCGPGTALAIIDSTTSLMIRTEDSHILKLVDLNEDDDVMDFGEVASYAQPQIVAAAIAHCPTSSHYVSAGISTGTVLRLIDLNGDGDAFDAGESSVFASDLPIIQGIAIRTGGCIPGDVNANGMLDPGDVAAFADALIGIAVPPDLCRVDLNNDEHVDGEDIAPFVQRMLE